VNKLSSEDIIKLAQSSEKAKNYILHLAKVAAGESEFDETPPAMNTEQLESDKAATPSEGPQKPVQEPAAVPTEEAPVESEPVPEGPEAIGARAAQNFIGPEIMQAAVSGDPMAQDLVARTAGQVAGAVAEAASRSSANMPPAGGEGSVESAPMAPAGAEQTPMAPAIATPEEDLANEIIPPQNAQPATPPQPGMEQGQPVAQGGEQGTIDQGKGPNTVVNPEPGAAPESKDDGKVDAKDVKRLIELAKAGKI